jgi:PhoPQ-activated pathogenicity-related protein
MMRWQADEQRTFFPYFAPMVAPVKSFLRLSELRGVETADVNSFRVIAHSSKNRARMAILGGAGK